MSLVIPSAVSLFSLLAPPWHLYAMDCGAISEQDLPRYCQSWAVQGQMDTYTKGVMKFPWASNHLRNLSLSTSNWKFRSHKNIDSH